MLKELQQKFSDDLKKTNSLSGLNNLYDQYLGRRGAMTDLLRSLKDLTAEEKKEKGRVANMLKITMEEALEKKKSALQFLESKSKSREWIDVTVPGIPPVRGHLHPITLVQRQVEDIFQSMGFSVVYGPEAETEQYIHRGICGTLFG